MSDTSRRKFLTVAGAGAAASAVAVGASAPAEAKPHPKRANERVVAVVDDPKKGVVRLLVGDREIVLRDRDLTTRILNAAGGK